jgi:hypothetical protein
MIGKALNATLALLLLCFSGYALVHALAESSSSQVGSKLSEVLLYAGFAATASGWLYSSFVPSKVATWLVCALALGSIWLNAFATMATRDEYGLAGATAGEWARMAVGASLLVVFVLLAVRARRASTKAGSSA